MKDGRHECDEERWMIFCPCPEGYPGPARDRRGAEREGIRQTARKRRTRNRHKLKSDQTREPCHSASTSIPPPPGNADPGTPISTSLKHASLGHFIYLLPQLTASITHLISIISASTSVNQSVFRGPASWPLATIRPRETTLARPELVGDHLPQSAKPSLIYKGYSSSGMPCSCRCVISRSSRSVQGRPSRQPSRVYREIFFTTTVSETQRPPPRKSSLKSDSDLYSQRSVLRARTVPFLPGLSGYLMKPFQHDAE